MLLIKSVEKEEMVTWSGEVGNKDKTNSSTDDYDERPHFYSLY